MYVHLDTQIQINQTQELRFSCFPHWYVRFHMKRQLTFWHFIASSPQKAVDARNSTYAYGDFQIQPVNGPPSKKVPEWRRNLNLNASLDWRHHVGIQALPGGDPVPAKTLWESLTITTEQEAVEQLRVHGSVTDWGAGFTPRITPNIGSFVDLEGLKYNNSKVENRLMDELNGQQHSLMGRCWEKVDRVAEDRANHAVCLLQRGDYPAMH